MVIGGEGFGKTAFLRKALSGRSLMNCPETDDRSKALRTLEHTEGSVIVLDHNLHDSGESLLEDLRWLTVEQGASVVVTVLSDRVYSSLKRNLSGAAVNKIEIGPLDRDSVKELAGDDIDEKELDSLIHLTKGSPQKILAALEVEIDETRGDDELEDHQRALLRLLKSSE